jgi:hypothetical protein
MEGYMTATTSEYQYVLSMGDELGEHANEWIAVVDNKIVAREKNAKEVYEKAKSYDSSKTPFIMRAPTSKVMVL